MLEQATYSGLARATLSSRAWEACLVTINGRVEYEASSGSPTLAAQRRRIEEPGVFITGVRWMHMLGLSAQVLNPNGNPSLTRQYHEA